MNWRRRVGPIVAAGLVGFVAPNAGAAHLPDWAKVAAATAPPLGEEISKDTTRILFSETRVTVQKDGLMTTRWRYASQALTTDVPRIAVQGYPYREGAQIVTSKAWLLPYGEKARKSYAPPVDISVDEGFLTDLKTRSVSVGGMTRGGIVFFEFEVDEVPPALCLSHLFYAAEAVQLDRLEVELPSAEWSLRTEWLRREGPAPTVDGKTWRWEMKDLPAPNDEPLSARAPDEAPLLLVGFTPPAGAKLLPLELADWKAWGLWYGALAKGRDAVTPEIQAAVGRVPIPADAGWFPKLRVLAKDVRDNVRYVAKEVGIGSYQPERATDVLNQRYGDCKAKGTLLQAYLAATGYTSYPVLINATTPWTVSERIPMPGAFNHLVVAVSVPESVKVTAEFAAATFEVSEFGRLLIIDATDPYTSIGYIPQSLEGKTGLLVAGARTRLIVLPKSDPSVHRVLQQIRTEVHGDGSFAVELTTRCYGQPASDARAQYRGSSVGRRKTAEASFLETFIRAEAKGYSAEPETVDGAFVEKTTWTVPPAGAGAADEIPLFAGAERYVPRTSLSKRKSPVVYAYPATVRSEAVVTGLPVQALVPEPDHRQGLGWSVALDCHREETEIKGAWEMVLKTARFEPEALGELRKLWQAVSSTGRAAISLREVGAGGPASER